MTATRQNRKRPRSGDEANDLWKDRAALLRVMAHPVRLVILDALSDGVCCVKDLNSLVTIPQPHLSQHMAALRKAKIVDSHSRGSLRCYYLLRPTLVKKLMRLLRQEHSPHFLDRAVVLRGLRRGG